MGNVLIRNNVKILGEGDQILMFGHGFGCDQNTWRYVFPAFLESYQIILFDYVGAGNSDLLAYNDERYSTLEGYAQDIIDICGYLDLKEVTFVGHSVSSMIGLLAAKMEPARFNKMIFIGPSPRYINTDDYHGGIDRSDLEDLLQLMDSNYLGWSKMLAPLIMSNAEQPHLSKELTESFCATDPSISKKFARVTFLSDNREDLASLTVPSLTIQCKDDFLTSEIVARYIQAKIPDNQVVILESSGHCPHLSDPDGVIKAISAFLS